MGPFLQVGGTPWDIVQTNGFRVSINIIQENDQLSASASLSAGRVQSIDATGFVKGPNFQTTGGFHGIDVLGPIRLCQISARTAFTNRALFKACDASY
jgi:hypothetical protein